jgi:enoyl-CoA hydratase/carnithine racemase
MDEIVAERSGSILRVELNRPAKKNAMTSGMYVTLAKIFEEAGKDGRTRVALWYGAGDSFCAGNDVQDFLEHPPGPGESPQALLMNALVDFDKPLIAAVHGAAIGGGTTMLMHCDFVYASETAKFQLPFINLALLPEFGSSFALPARIGHIRAGIDLVGTAVRRQAGREFGIGDAGRGRSGSFEDGHGGSAEIGSEAGRRAASKQETHEAEFPRADQDGHEGRKRGIQRAGAL